MKKTLLALGIALSILTCNSMVAFAVEVCPSAPDKAHHFNTRSYMNESYTVDLGTHRYTYGYDVNGEPIYRYDCRQTDIFLYFGYKCQYCGIFQEGVKESQHLMTKHSINHG